MIKLLTRPVVWPAKASAYSLAAGYKTGRLVGYRRLSVFGLGVVVGLLSAPVPGRELRAQLTDRLGLQKRVPLPATSPSATPSSSGPSSSVAVPATEGEPGGSSSGGVSGSAP